MAHPEKTPRNGGAGLPGADLTAGAIDPGNNASNLERQRLELFAVRCQQMVERVNAGAVPFIWGVDCLYDAATWSGLIDDLGDDAVQATMADAFVRARR